MYGLRFAGKSRNHIRRLDQDTKRRILGRIEELRADPYSPAISEPLTARPGLRKSRVGGWRIVYEPQREGQIIDVLVVQPRGQAYNRL